MSDAFSDDSEEVAIFLEGEDYTPPDVTGFGIDIAGQTAKLEWEADTSGEIAGYELRFTPITTGAVWEAMTVLGDTAGTFYPVPLRDGSYAIKARGFGGVLSATAAFTIVSGSASVNQNIVQVLGDAGTWAGAKSATVKDGADLRLVRGGNLFSQADFFATSDFFTVPNSQVVYAASGTYTLPGTIDLGDVYVSRVTPYLYATGSKLDMDVFGVNDWFGTDNWFGFGAADWNARVQISTSQGDPTATVSRASVGTYFDANGILQTAPANTARLNYDPANLNAEPILLAEPARTNIVRNNTAQGAVAGVIGSGGALPTYWTLTSGIVNREIVGFGLEAGVDYVDIRFFGTPTSTGVMVADPNGNTAISAGETWATSQFMKLVAGSLANVSPFELCLNGEAPRTAYTPDGTLRRYSNVRTASGTVARLVTRWSHNNTSTPVDYTLRFGLPQCEKGDNTSTPIKTSGAAATRATETILAAPNWSDWRDIGTEDVKARAMRFRLLLESFSVGVTPKVSGLSITVDMPDIVQGGKNIAVPATGLAIAFDKPFKELKGLSTAVQNLATGDYVFIDPALKGPSGFTVQVRNSAGTGVARSLDYTALGYGRKS